MIYFRKVLIFIRRQFAFERKKFLSILLSLLGLSICLAFFVDSYTPRVGWWVVLRSFLLIPLAGSMFISGYVSSVYGHTLATTSNADWVAYRERFSAAWRLRFSIIVGAFLVVLMYASDKATSAYTFINGLVLACALGLMAFCRRTHEEQVLAKYKIADSRDLNFNRRLAQLQKERELAESLAEAKKKERRAQLFGLESDLTEELKNAKDKKQALVDFLKRHNLDSDFISADDLDFLAEEE